MTSLAFEPRSIPTALHARPAGRTSPSTTVPREYVHKTAFSEVLLTGWEETGEDSFALTAQWPRSHSFHTPAHGLHDPLLFVETVRQTFPLLSHLGYGVPLGHHLIWDTFRYVVDLDALATGPRPADIALQADCFDIVRRGNRLAALSLRVRAVREGALLGVATARFTSNTPAVYRRLRGDHGDLDRALAAAVPPPSPVPAAHVGRERAQDVVLSATGTPNRWQLRVDTSHPILFDHPVDHVPGAVLLEAARQAAHAVTGAAALVPVSMDTSFSRFAELDAPCWIDAVPGPHGGLPTVQVTARQHGEPVFTTTVALEPTSATTTAR